MANYDNLPVFKACYDLLLRIFQLGQHWRRDVRHTLGEEIKKEIIVIQQCIYQANASHQKIASIQSVRVLSVKVKLQLRIAHDLKELSLNQYITTAELVESISKQLFAWEKSQTKQHDLK